MAKSWRCAEQRVPTPLPAGSASAPRSRLLRGAASAGAMGVEVGSMRWPPWGSQRRRSCASFTPPPPTAAKSASRKGSEPRPRLCAALFPDRASPSTGVSAPQPGDREAVGLARRGGWVVRGCAAAAPGSLITSARSAPARSSQLPSNAREFNSSINRREALHFGELASLVGLGAGPTTDLGSKPGTAGEHGCEASGPQGQRCRAWGWGQQREPRQKKGEPGGRAHTPGCPSSARVPENCRR